MFYSTDWKRGGFDSSDWQVATEYHPNGQGPWGNINHVSRDAQWIWVSPMQVDSTVYCRIELQRSLVVNYAVDNGGEVYADGNKIGETEGWSSGATARMPSTTQVLSFAVGIFVFFLVTIIHM